MSYAVSAEGLALIQEHEGFISTPQPLAGEGWVVGFGHVRVGDAGGDVSRDDAAALLARDLGPFADVVNAAVTQPISQSQFDALVSFAFSVGKEAFGKSQVLRRLNAGDFAAAACAMEAWRKAEIDGEVVIAEALVRRRAAEKALFLRDMKSTARPSRVLRPQLDHAAAILGAPSPSVSAPLSAVAPARSVGARLTEILKSEPATAALLLTDIVADAPEAVEEITTAHAKPVSRVDAPTVQWRAFVQKWTRIDAAHSAEMFGLFALLAFGAVLVVMAVSMVATSGGDWAQLVGAAALAAPGAAAVLMAGYGLWRTPRSEQAQRQHI